ncbi:MAG: hypothetical protein WCJ14_02735 [Verrucomicrobiota bacterium]
MTRAKPFAICATAGDPGGAAAVAPVLELLAHNPVVNLIACPYNEAMTLWQNRGIPCQAAGILSVQDFRALMRSEQVDLLLTGTSVNSRNCEHQALQAAREMGIPSLAVLDYWANYALRFSSSANLLDFLPDRIAVMDPQAKSEAIADGIPAGRLVVTGQPAFDSLADCRRMFDDGQRARLREAHGIAGDDLMVFFPSQPTSVFCGVDASNPLYLGYTEQEVAGSLITALEAIAKARQCSITLVTRPHPREDGAWLERLHGKHIRIQPARQGTARELCMAADLVVGMDTVLLVEACYLQSFVLSIQPNLIGKDTVPTNRLGASTGIYHPQAVQPALERLLFDPTTRRTVSQHLATMAGPGTRAAAAVERLILPNILST